MGTPAFKESQTLKISSKRQITIPAKYYEAAGFDQYALCTWTEDGLLIQPLKVKNEDNTVDILRQLVAEGYEGEELIQKYEEIQSKIVSVKQKLQEAEDDITAGRVAPADEMMDRLGKKYGFSRRKN